MAIKQCECGCGGEVTYNKYNPRKYIHNHWAKGKNNPFYGKKHSEDTLKKMSEIKKNISEETRKKMSDSHKMLVGEKNPFFGKHHTKEFKKRLSEDKERAKKISESLKGRKFSKEQCKKLSESLKKGYEEGRLKPNKGTFKKGDVSHNKGKTKETYEPLRRTSEKHKGKIFSEEHKRNISKTHRPMDGANNHAWMGGKSFELYGFEFNNKFKNKIKERDGCCLVCNISIEDLKAIKRYVHIHHINYDKQLTIPQNCCVLCNSCHSKTQFNRKHWTTFLQSIMNERYDYIYSEDNKIVLM